MISIEVGNSFSKVVGLNSLQHKQLARLLSYEQGFQTVYRRSLLNAKGIFPSGLIHRVQKFFGSACQLIDSRKRPEPRPGIFRLSLPFAPYQEQKDAVEAFTASGTLRLPTGTGKSLAMAMLVDKMQLKTLIVVPNLGLKEQLLETFRSVFPDTHHNIRILNIDSPILEKMTDFDLLILDECHHSAASTYRKLNKTAWKGIYYRACFTATDFRSDPEEQLLMESVAGQLRYHLGYHQSVAKGFIVSVEAYYIELPRMPVEGYTWQQVYNEIVIDRDDRNSAIATLLERLQRAGKSVLTLVKEVRHGHILEELTGHPCAHAEDDDCRELISQFSSGDINSLIATTGVCGEGIDTKPAEYVIIAGLGKSKNAFMQNIGRGIRKYPGKESCKVILFLDRSHKWSLSHFNAQRKILRDEYGVEAVKLELDL